MAWKRKLNSAGVIDSNSCIFNFLIPSFFAAITSGITQGIGNTEINHTYSYIDSGTNATVTSVEQYYNMVQPGRSHTRQGGYQVLAWLFSVAVGAVTGLLIGLIYRAVNEHSSSHEFFNDSMFFNTPGEEDRVFYPKSSKTLNNKSVPTKQPTPTPAGNSGTHQPMPASQMTVPQSNPAGSKSVILNFDVASD